MKGGVKKGLPYTHQYEEVYIDTFLYLLMIDWKGDIFYFSPTFLWLFLLFFFFFL